MSWIIISKTSFWKILMKLLSLTCVYRENLKICSTSSLIKALFLVTIRSFLKKPFKTLIFNSFFLIQKYSGFAHSTISPILHWILNYNSLRQSTCQPFAKLNSAQRFLRSHLRFTGPPPPPPSSTNEAALGPFNPRFIKQRPQVHKPPASSHYLYWVHFILSCGSQVIKNNSVMRISWMRVNGKEKIFITEEYKTEWVFF